MMLMAVPSTVDAANIYIIETNGDTVVKCIANYVFVFNKNGGVTQFMYYDDRFKAMVPVTCNQYKI
jgi:hypothetical protein